MGMKSLLSDLNYPEAPEVESFFIFGFSFLLNNLLLRTGESCRDLYLQKEPVAEYQLSSWY